MVNKGSRFTFKIPIDDYLDDILECPIISRPEAMFQTKSNLYEDLIMIERPKKQ